MALSDEVGTDLEQVEVIQRKFDDFQKVCFASNDVFLIVQCRQVTFPGFARIPINPATRK